MKNALSLLIGLGTLLMVSCSNGEVEVPSEAQLPILPEPTVEAAMEPVMEPAVEPEPTAVEEEVTLKPVEAPAETVIDETLEPEVQEELSNSTE